VGFNGSVSATLEKDSLLEKLHVLPLDAGLDDRERVPLAAAVATGPAGIRAA
jgi:hypothetical protein